MNDVRLAPIALVLAALAPWSPAASANPLDAYGFGGRSIAMGGAVAASAEDSSAAYYNPANLALSRSLRIELGYAYHSPELDFGQDAGVDPSRGVQAGFVLPGEVFERPVAVALSLFLPTDWVTRVRTAPVSERRFILFDNRPQRLYIATALSAEILPGLYLGAGLTYLANTGGVLDMEGVVNTGDTERTRLFGAVGVDFTSIRYASAGVLYSPIDRLQIAAVFRDEFTLHLDIDVNVHGDVTLGEEEIVAVENGSFLLASRSTDLFSPRQVVLAVSWRGDGWTAEADLTWAQWSRFPAPAPYLDLDLNLPGLDFDVPIPDDPPPPGFHDIVVPRVGVELDLVDGEALGLRARAGYFFEPSPAPDQPGVTNLIDSDKHGFGLGFGLSLHGVEAVLPKPLELDVALHGARVVPRDYQKDDPADPVGSFRAHGWIIGAGATAQLVF